MIPVSENQVIYSGNGVNTAFSYSFKIIESTDLHLIRVAADGTETEVTSDYYVDMAASKVYYPGYAPGVEEAEADQPQILQTGEKLVVYRNVPITQQDDMPEQWPFDVIESALDKSCIIDQQLKGDIDRALKFSRAVGSNFNPTFPIIAGKTIRIKNDGSGFETTDDPAVVRTEVVALKNETVTAKNAAETAQANAEAAASTAAATAATTAVANVQSQLAQNLADTNAAKTAAQTASSSAQSALSSAQNAASVAQRYAEACEGYTVPNGSVSFSKLGEDLQKYKIIRNSTVDLVSGYYIYENCTVNPCGEYNHTATLTGHHIFRNCTIKNRANNTDDFYDLVINGGCYEFYNCNIGYIIINECKNCIVQGCIGEGVRLLGSSDGSIVRNNNFKSVATNQCPPIAFVGGIAKNIIIDNNVTENTLPTSTTTALMHQCINAHGVCNSIISNNICISLNSSCYSLDIAGHGGDGDIIRSVNNVVSNNKCVGALVSYNSKDINIISNTCSILELSYGESKSLDYGVINISNNIINNALRISNLGETVCNATSLVVNVYNNNFNGNLGVSAQGSTTIKDGISIKVRNNYFTYRLCTISDADTYAYIKQLDIPITMQYVPANSKCVLPCCIVVDGNLVDVVSSLTAGKTFAGGVVENTTSSDRYVRYKKIAQFNGQIYGWSQ